MSTPYNLPAAIRSEDFDVLPPPPPAQGRWAKLYRSALFQICVVSALAFCGPAMADSISGLGGGGQATPYTVSEYLSLLNLNIRVNVFFLKHGISQLKHTGAAQAASYCAVATISLFGGPLASRMGLKLMLILGAATFPINGSAYYVNSAYSNAQWYLIFGRFIYGLGFGFWYVAEAAIILSYPEEGRRGK